MKYLGYANGWKEKPEEVVKCDHKLDVKYIDRCVREYSCPVCGYCYKVDSGD